MAIDRHLRTIRNAHSDLCQRFDILTHLLQFGLARVT